MANLFQRYMTESKDSSFIYYSLCSFKPEIVSVSRGRTCFYYLAEENKITSNMRLYQSFLYF
jgi:hypothetical protein